MHDGLDRRLVAVMFTDMAGYTALIQQDEELAVERRNRYVEALDRAHQAFGGTVVQRLGDGSMSMFPSALAAVEAAVQMQRELVPGGVEVRIGVHVGEVVVEAERLTGEAVNVAARIESFAVPGGVLLSDAAYEQIRNRSDVDVVSLGRFRLKHVGRPFELYAVAADGLSVPDAAALEGKGERLSALPGRLPESIRLIGRAADLTELAELVRAHRLVTITGPGGVGKTSTLVELGRALAPEFPDGFAFAPMADVIEAAGFVPALAEALDVKESEERTLGEGITALVADREALLLLDNLEQIVEGAATEVRHLTDSCPGVRIVATSRTPLRIGGEAEYPLAPLETGDAVALFTERARATRGSFEADEENRAVVEALCRRLDGLPLALELAAARLRVLTPEALLERLDHALDVLTSGQRDTAERQRTLRATIEWSHSLLDEAEQRLFRRLAVFAGGFTFDDVEAVCADAGTTCLDELESLVEKALVQSEAGRLRLLQTIAEFARERLDASGEAEETARRHAHRYAEVTREIRDGVEGTSQLASVERGIAEEGNIQAALETLLAAARAGDEEACEAGMQFSGDLWMYWHIRGKNVTAREYATAFLAADRNGERSIGRAGALITAGLASWMTAQWDQANAEWGEAYRIAEERDAGRERCLAALCLGLGMLPLDAAQALPWEQVAVEQSRAIGFDWSEGIALSFMGMALALTGDAAAARAAFTDALAIQERLGDCEGAGMSLGGLAQLALADGDPQAQALFRASLEQFETAGDRGEEARILSEMGWADLERGDPTAARQSFFAAVQAHTDVASVRGVGLALVGLAAAEAAEGRNEQAVQIAAAAEVYAQGEGIVVVYFEAPGHELVERAREALSPEDAARAAEAGRRLSMQDALALARAGA